MSFSSDVKKDLSKLENFNKEVLYSELLGYMISGNTAETEKYFEFVTENEFNIEHLYKILFNLGINYEPEVRGKCYCALMEKSELEDIENQILDITGELKKSVIKGAFLGTGSVNNPEKNYHLEISFNKEKYKEIFLKLCEEYKISFKQIMVNDKYQLYLKEGEEISRFLALIGASKAVMYFEDVRVVKEMKNNINRRVNCETANLSKTIDAALRQMEDINFIKKMNKFDDLSSELKEVANLRLENPDLSLKDLGELLNPVVRKVYDQSKIEKNQ